MGVHADAIASNWRFFQRLAPNAECSAVVKADGYGLGAAAVSRALAQAGARTFFTATSGEAREVRTALGEGPRIFVLNGVTQDDVGSFEAARLIPVLNSLAQVMLWNGRGAAALHIDTGMNRLGVGGDDLAFTAAQLKGSQLELIMSHLACASDVAHAKNAEQRQRFLAAKSLFNAAPLSLAATAGAQLGADYHFDMIRPGIGLYGSAGLDANNPPLAPAVTIEAPILQVRDVPAGETFGYGATFTATKPMRTATVALGYADGYLRSLSGRGYGVIDGVRAPPLGRVSMDLLIFDVTAHPRAAPGDWIELLGPNAPIDEIASLAGTLPYELLTTFAGTVRRRGVSA